jgi:hypothetical protein
MHDRSDLSWWVPGPTALFGADTDRLRPVRQAVECTVAAAFGVPVAELRASTRRDARTAFARQTAMYLARVSLGLSFRDAGRMFGRDRTTAAYACRVVEDRRDNPQVDAQVQLLEHACGDLWSGLAAAGKSR